MTHIAIMNKSWQLLPKIPSGIKRIESRWYKNRTAPWGKVSVGETIYFKDAGEPVTVKATVSRVEQFENLTKSKVIEILTKYSADLGFNEPDYSDYYDGKNYCILVWLENPEPVTPFQINKTGFGNACAWMCIDDVNQVKIDS